MKFQKIILKKTALVSLLTLLVSCGTLQTVRTTIAVRGQNAADQTLESAVWTLCKATPVGAIKRKFKTESEQSAYNALCKNPEL